MKISQKYIRIIKIVLLLSMLLLLWQFVKNTDLAEVMRALQRVGSGFLWIMVSTFAAYWCGTIGWWYCLGDDRKSISQGRLFMLRHVCETVGMFNPASVAGGDMLKVILLKPYSISQPIALNSVIMSRILMIASQLLLFVVAMLWLLSTQGPQDWLVGNLDLFTGAFVLVFVLFGTMCYFWIKNTPEIREPAVIADNRGKLHRVRQKVSEVRLELHYFLTRHPKNLFLAILFFLLHWLIGSLEFYIILKLLGYDVTLMHGLLLDMGVVVVKSFGAFIPGQIGVEELGNKLMLGVIGIASASLWLSVSALRRTRQIVWILIGAAFYVFFIGKNKIEA